jgi:hypothetical protein
MKIPVLLSLACCLFVPAASAQIIEFDLLGKAGSGLLPGNENPAASSSASGGEIGAGIFLDLSTNILTVNVGWGSGNGFTDLTGAASAAHFHGPADANTNAGVILGLNAEPGSISWDSSASSGSITGTVDLDLVTLGNGGTIADLLNGEWYLNIHTAANPGGELRANLVNVSAVPEPSTYALFGGLAAFGAIAWRRRKLS